jgi:hypothetical protein
MAAQDKQLFTEEPELLNRFLRGLVDKRQHTVRRNAPLTPEIMNISNQMALAAGLISRRKAGVLACNG